MRHALIVTDRTIMKLGLPERVRILLEDAKINTEIYDAVHVEPTDQSFEEIGSFVRGHDFDGFVAVGGSSSIDSAKAANLLSTYPAPVIDYINKPIG